MISHKHRCIFIHIPKTGGMSVEQAFLKSLGLRFYLGQNAPLLLSYNKNLSIGPQSLAHLSPLDYVKHSYLSETLFNDYYKFAIVRNPWERMVSIYKHFSYHRYISFKTFLEIEFPKLKADRYYFVKPQVEYIYDVDGNLLIDFVGRFENLETDFKFISNQVDYQVAPLEHINKSNTRFKRYGRGHLKFVYKALKEKPYLLKYLNLNITVDKDYRTLYCDTTRSIVQDFYAEDIKMFNYSF